MLIIPAIDLLGGACVRLYKGDYTKATLYSRDPGEVARRYQEAGARLIHIVDLDSARGNRPGNRNSIRAIRKAVSVQLQAGGGVRSGDDIQELLDCGVERIIIGTALIREPERVARWISAHKFYAIAGLDAEMRKIRIQGWTDDAGLDDSTIAEKLGELGFREIIYTNIARDGTLSGPDIKSTNEIAAVSGLAVILSGGIGCPGDVKSVAENRHSLVKGVIIGKALYEAKVSLEELVGLYQGADDVINESKGKI